MDFAGDPISTNTVVTSALLILWGRDGAFAGGFSVLRGTSADRLLSFAVVEANGAPPRELLVETTGARPTTMTQIEVRGTDRALAPSAVEPQGLPPFADLNPQLGGRIDLVARGADLDGDGVDDLVLAAPDGMHVCLGCGRHAPPSAACP